mgnify:CR=1 FL=1
MGTNDSDAFAIKGAMTNEMATHGVHGKPISPELRAAIIDSVLAGQALAGGVIPRDRAEELFDAAVERNAALDELTREVFEAGFYGRVYAGEQE